MNPKILLQLIGDEDMTEAEADILLHRAARKAINQHFWGANDVPTEEQLEAFFARYEFEIYDIAVAMKSEEDHDGEISHTELGITRVWASGDGTSKVDKAVSVIPRKTYVWSA